MPFLSWTAPESAWAWTRCLQAGGAQLRQAGVDDGLSAQGFDDRAAHAAVCASTGRQRWAMIPTEMDVNALRLGITGSSKHTVSATGRRRTDRLRETTTPHKTRMVFYPK